MMKKVSALLLIFALVITSVICVPASANVDTVVEGDTEETRLLKGIGIIDDDFSFNMPVTRGMYATYVARLFGDVPHSNSAASTYIDVKADTAECHGISLLTSMGYLSGYGDGTFRPERPVSLNEATKVIVDILGYKFRAVMNGGYPIGYSVAAQNLGLLKGVNTEQSYFYGADFATLLYNAIDVDVMMENGLVYNGDESSVTMETVKGHTILTENLDMYTGEGVIGANSVTNLDGVSINKKELWIDGNVVKNENPEYWNMVGCMVDYVYRQTDENGEKELVYASPKDNSVLTLNKETFLNLNGLKVEYSDADGKIKKANLSGEVDFVYNGEVVVFNKSYIDNFRLGTIKLIENTGDSSYDVVVIDNYTSFVVDSVNANKFKLDSDVEQGISLTLDEDKYDVINLLNADGKATTFDNITEGTIVSYFVNGSYIKAYISKDLAEGVVEAISKSGDEKVYHIKGKLYTEPERYTGKSADVGDSVTIYVDAFGYIANINQGFTDTLQAGFLLKGASDNKGLDKRYGFKIYTNQDKVLTVFAADKIYYNGVSTKVEELPASFEQSIVCYELNDAGELVTLETPVPRDENYVDGRLMTIYPKTANTSYYSSMFDSKVVFDGTTTMFSIPDIEGELTENMINAITLNALEDRQAYTLEGFAVSAESPRLKAMIMYGNVTDGIPRGENLATLVKINHVMNEEDYDVYEAEVLVEGVEKKFYISDDVSGVANPGDLKPGDCFRYATNSDGEIHLIDRMYTIEDGWIPGSYEYFPVEGISETVMHYGEVLDNDGAYLRVKFDDAPYTGFIQDYYAIPMSHYTAVTVITVGSRGCTVTKGSIRDAAKGDKIINYRNLMAAVGFVLIKEG